LGKRDRKDKHPLWEEGRSLIQQLEWGIIRAPSLFLPEIQKVSKSGLEPGDWRVVESE
jgi:hypothetical protein